ncbi:MAG: CRP/FNR family cyclic AMP-dependent transcriptional regulator [Gammaproteobacteria bacterium]|jgi:CRP/FNR family cyclic AMP-dependent transcriptional regulator
MSHIFWSNIFNRQTTELQTIVRLWQDTPLFEGIPTRHIKFLAGKMHVRNFVSDEMIFQQGNQGAGALLVLEGTVRIMTNKTELALLNVGDFFGEIALAEPEQRTADAFSVASTRLVYFLKQDLEEWIEFEPRLGARFLMNLSATLARRLLQANKLIAAQ